MDVKQQNELNELYKEISDNGGNADEAQELYDKYCNIGFTHGKAVEFLRKKHGLTKEFAPPSELSGVESLDEENNNAELEAVIQTRFERQSGGMYYGRLTALGKDVRYSAFTPDFPAEAGDKIKLTGCQIKKWQGEPQVTIGDRTKIEILEKAQDMDPVEVTVDQLDDVHGKLIIEGRIVECRHVNSDKVKNPFWRGIIADETGPVDFTSWEIPLDFKTGQAIRLEGVMPQTYRGTVNLYIDDQTKILDAKKTLPELKDLPTSRRVKLGDVLKHGHNQNNVQAKGLVAEVKDGSGLIYRCPDCNRLLMKNNCRIHGQVKGTPDLRLKIILDDETSTAIALLGREGTEQILGKTLEDIIKETQESMNFDHGKDLLTEAMLGQYVEATGNALVDEYGITMLTNTLTKEKPNSEELLAEAKQLREGFKATPLAEVA